MRHGCTHSSEHNAWRNLWNRCTNPNFLQFKDYGGRGIKVCRRWDKFENFLADMGKKPSPKHSLDRKNNDGNYTPKNCRWATRAEQMRNTRRNCLVTHEGRIRVLTDWCLEKRINVNTVKARLRSGWSVSRALTVPSKSIR